MSILRTVLLFLLMIGLPGIPAFAKKPAKPCEDLSIVKTRVDGSSLFVDVANPANMRVKGYIVAHVQVGGELLIFYSGVSVPKASVATYQLKFKDPINVLFWIRMSCDIPPEAATEGPDPIIHDPTVNPGGGKP